MQPNKEYIVLLDIKSVMRDWQDCTIGDKATIAKIEDILNNLRKQNDTK